MSDAGMDSGEESDFYDATLFPVFVTADVGLELINTCLTRSATYTENAGLDGLQALYLIPDPSFPHPTAPMDLPVSSFTSPFLNKSIDELIEIFESKVSADEDSEHDLMAASVFMILDEQSKQDNCLQVVQITDEESGVPDGSGYVTARCEFEIAAIYAMGPEQGTMELGEGEEGFAEEGREVKVTRERFEALMEEDEEMGEDDEEEEDGDEE